MEGCLKRIKELEKRVDRMERSLQFSKVAEETTEEDVLFAHGDRVLAKLGVNEIAGIVSDYVSECKGYSIFIPERFQYVFVAEKMLSHNRKQLPKTGLPNHDNVAPLHFRADATIIAEVHPAFVRWADSYQYGKVLQVYPATKEYLVQFIDFDERNWDEGYEVVNVQRVDAIPVDEIQLDSLKVDMEVIVDHPKLYGFWKAVYLGRVGGKPAFRYLNKHCNEDIVLLTKEKIYKLK